MLSFKDGKTMKPLFDYYVETDLDTIDDQPIDYSKRYDDEDDVCGSSSSKKRHLSNASENAVPNKTPGDELKVYCIEGTPLIISSASSLCDLLEIGVFQASEREPSKDGIEQKPGFQDSYFNTSEDGSSHAKCEELLEVSKCEQVQSESKESATQENASPRSEENFSKASSPLMFSRSSSICSLNSFEQNSIVDDRSSISMFSNLASGIISPSEIPDSPGEAMSPFIRKQNSEFVFPPSNPQPKSMDPILAKLKLNNPNPPFIDEAIEDIPEDNLKFYNDEGDCCSVSNLSSLSIQTGSLNRVSVAVFHKRSIPVVEHKSSIRISCSIVTGNAELQSIEEDTVKVAETKNDAKSFGSYACGDCMMEEEGDQDEKKNFSLVEEEEDVKINYSLVEEEEDEKINFSLVEEEEDCKNGVGSPIGGFSFKEGFEPHSGSYEKLVEEDDFHPENESPGYSKDNSDDEDCDALLEECIQSGMPSSNESLHQHSRKLSSNSCLIIEELTPERESEGLSLFCDTSDSEEEDLLLQSCIQLGMPQKSSNEESNDSNNHIMSSNSPLSFTKEVIITEVSDDEDYDPLLQQVIQLGKPKNESKDSCCNNSTASNSYSSGHLDLGYRDNRPDGTSDEEEDDDDDILTECIQAGMPKPKIDESKKLYSLPTKSHNVKPEPHRLSPAGNDRAAYLSSFAGPHQPSRKFPTKECRTFHSKANQQRKYPTKEDRAIFLPSYYNRQHQQHKRSPSAEDRAMLVSSSGGQQHYSEDPQLPFHRKSPARMVLPTNAAQHRKSPVVLDRTMLSYSEKPAPMFSIQRNQATSFSNSANQSTMFSNMANQPLSNPANQAFSNHGNPPKRIHSPASDSYQKKYQSWIHDLRDPKVEPSPIPDTTCIFRTEDTPILSPSASVSDLSTLSFSEDRMYLDCSLNNSRNSDCSSESEEDELLRQCIRSGMPSEKRALA